VWNAPAYRPTRGGYRSERPTDRSPNAGVDFPLSAPGRPGSLPERGGRLIAGARSRPDTPRCLPAVDGASSRGRSAKPGRPSAGSLDVGGVDIPSAEATSAGAGGPRGPRPLTKQSAARRSGASASGPSLRERRCDAQAFAERMGWLRRRAGARDIGCPERARLRHRPGAGGAWLAVEGFAGQL